MTTPTISHAANDVAGRVTDLREILVVLAELLPEPVTDPTAGNTHTRRGITGSPAPWHAEAAGILLDIHEGVRRLEASIRRDVTGHLGPRRGGSDGNTQAALTAITNLTYALNDDQAKQTGRILGIWLSHARQIRDIDLEPSWAPLPSVPGTPPPACPYCRTYGLRFARQSGAVRCANPRCVDTQEQRPYGLIEQGKYTGRAMLVFADGREITYAAQEAAYAAAG